MKRQPPHIALLCPDCGASVHGTHKFLSQRNRNEYKLLNVRTKKTCRVIYRRDSLTSEVKLIPTFTKGVKHVPTGKRRDRRGQGKPK